MKLKGTLEQYLWHLEGQSLKVGDVLEITPVRGRKKTIVLNRSNYKIKLSLGSMEVKREEAVIYVPAAGCNVGEFDLILYQGRPFDAYILKGENENFFSQNGVITNFGFLRNNDHLSLGLSHFKFYQTIKRDRYKGQAFIADERIVRSDYSLLIQGETGTGKTSLAHKIHRDSGKVGRFVHLNLSSFSRELVESELFGHTKGAFTGAVLEKMGAIKEAHRGTLFLDEIDSIDLEIQTKLLTFLDHGEYRQVGGGVQKSSVRMIFSTGRELKNLVEKGKIRLDFYYRIKNSLVINLPNLRDDKDLLKNHILRIIDEHSYSICPKLLDFYLKLPWYGNIRELKAHLEGKILFNKTKYLKIDERDLLLRSESIFCEKLIHDPEVLNLNDLKKWYVKSIKDLVEGDIKKASTLLGVSENTVRRFG